MSFVQDSCDFDIFRRVDAVIIVYDCCDNQSFSSVQNWYEEVQICCNLSEHPVVLVGNKIDLTNKRVVDCFHAKEYADKLGFFAYVEISAKLGQGVTELFKMIAKELVSQSQVTKVSILLL